MIPFLIWQNRRKDESRPKASKRLGRWIDNVASDLAPAWGAKRVAARHRQQLAEKQVQLFQKLGYSWPGAAPSEVRDGRYLNSRLSPDEAIEHDLPQLRRRCVELYRGNTVAHAAVEGRVANEVGTGITRHPRVRETEGISKENAESINDALKEICDRWSDHGVDKRRRLSLPAVQRLACRTYANYGECFIVLGEAKFRGSIGLTLDVISPERVETPPEMWGDTNVRMGIRYQGEEIVGYYVRNSHPDANRGHTVSYKFEPRFDESGQARVLHVFDPVFPEQSRGVPWLAAALNRAKDVDDFFEAELIAKQIEACFGLIFTGGKDSPDPISIAEGNATAKTSSGLRREDLAGGFVHYASDGETVSTVDPNRPGSSFAPFIEASLRSVAAAINFPYEILAKNFFRTTFSSGRLAMLDGWMAFSMRQQVLIEQFLKPVWRRLVHDAVFIGELDGLVDPVDYLQRPWVYERHRWTSQGRGFIDPKSEVNAQVTANEGGIATKATIFGEKGEDWEDAAEQLDAEERKSIELRIERELWEDKLRESRGLKPINRVYTENIGGADRETSEEEEPASDQETEDSESERELEAVS